MVKYDWLNIRNVFSGEVIINDENGEPYSYLDDIPRGWRIAFGEVMVDELNDILVKYNFADKYRISQIKEKFGGLRWYDNGFPADGYDEYNAWLDRYEKLSYDTCIRCGKLATHITKGWIEPLCNECDKKYLL